MSAQTIHNAFAPAEARYKSAVMEATWGHLAPKMNRTYSGKIVYAVGCFGNDPLNPTPLVCEFEDLDSSPWFFDAMTEFIASQESKPGGVYEFRGMFRNFEFKGQIVQIWSFI